MSKKIVTRFCLLASGFWATGNGTGHAWCVVAVVVVVVGRGPWWVAWVADFFSWGVHGL
jgi:hypothetical protein